MSTMTFANHHLPTPLAPLIGREREIRILAEKLRESQPRLFTLTGPGGVGKTRLALQVAAEIADEFAHGALFVSLAPIHDPELVLPTIAQVLGVRETSTRTLADRLQAVLRDRELLLVLDNLEQVVAVAPRIATLVAACPRLKVLVTSRVRLHVSGEQTFLVPPLPLPEVQDNRSPADIPASPAVRLFVARAGAVQFGFELTSANAATLAAICTRLDGLPLAIELAAARVGLFPPAALLARLERALPLLTDGARDAPVRLQSMRDAIAWSYDLLSRPEQVLFRRLAVFVGGFTLEAAAAVVDGLDNDELDVVAGIASLLDKSLVRRLEQPMPGGKTGSDSEPRFSMLETIREFGLEQLAASGEDELIRQVHAAWCVAMAERADPEMWGAGQTIWLARLKGELDNIRAALAWGKEQGDDQLILYLGGLLWAFWMVQGHAAEGLRWLHNAEERTAEAPAALRARVLFASGLLCGWVGGDYALGADRCAASAELWRGLGETWLCALALNLRGVLRGEQGDFGAARRYLEESLALCREIGHEWGIGLGLLDLGKALTYEHNYAEAEPLIEASLTHFRAAGDHWQVAEALGDLGGIAQVQGNPARVALLAAESLRLIREQGWLWYLPESLELLGGVALARGETERATRLLGAAEAQREASGAVRQPLFRASFGRHIETARTALESDTFEVLWSAGRGATAEAAIAEALAIAALPDATRETREDDQSARREGLSRREVEILRLVTAGQTDREIAEALFISRRTVTTHLSSVYAKLGVQGRSEAIAFAVRRGLA